MNKPVILKKMVTGLLVFALSSVYTIMGHAAVMNDYCIQPPFVTAPIQPNLLLLIDNSASMYDMAYSDTGYKKCSTTDRVCSFDKDCPGSETCSRILRQPYYCYDQTYKSTNSYAGYFEPAKYYQYNFTGNYFEETGSFPTCSGSVSGTSYRLIANQLCVIHTGSAVSTFVGKGNYLNWLTQSKLDVQKEILTGGKFVGGKLVSESRGCVGQGFVKEPLTANFVNYQSPESNNTNTGLGITFGVRGPYDPVNKSAPSPGGQTFLDVYSGNYNQGNCQAAVDAIVSGGNADIKNAVEACLSYSGTGTQTATVKTKVTFQQSMQACWQLREGHAIGGDDINTVKNQCTDIYDEYGTCSNNPDKVCAASSDCGTGNTCYFGPAAITAGNPALLCSSEYEGQYYELSSSTGVCQKKNQPDMGACASDADCTGAGYKCAGASGAGWQLKSGVTEAMMIATHTQFCNDMNAPPVIDPTDAPSDTSKYDNVPAILSGVGVEAQLNAPIATLTVSLSKSGNPSGVIQEFSNLVRIGAMTFDFAGSATESTSGILPAPKICSNDSAKICTSNIDCVAPGTCNATVSGTTNLDGGKIIHYVGAGHCSTTTTTSCANDGNCPSGETCVSDGVGAADHSSGLVKAIDDIRGVSWTPFAEAYYNAMGYFAKTSEGRSRTDLRLNAADFDENKTPSLYRCQANNILIISDGMSTADRNADVDNLAKLYTAAGGSTSWTTSCPSYGGSVNLDNLAWIAKHRNINTFSKSSASTTEPLNSNEFISTYVVYNGDSNGQAGECNSQTLMKQTAEKGGTTLYQSANPAELETAMRDAFTAIAAGVSSGTAASILSNNDNNGANLLQAIFYPKKAFGSTEISWIGEIQNLWYYIDPFLLASSIREDTVADKKLKLTGDYVTNFFFDTGSNRTKVRRYRDTDGNGSGDTLVDTIDSDAVNSLWKAGTLLWERNLTSSPRVIYTGFGSNANQTPRKFSVLDADGYLPTWPNTWAALQTAAGSDAERTAEATKIINYVHGIDQTGYRNRTVTISNSSGVWRLGDIISSTPRLQSSVKLNTYDLPAPNGYKDSSYSAYVASTNYTGRGMAYVGANDGMLHAFNLGVLTKGSAGSGEVSVITGSNLGKEAWAFIPKNSLPYLKYLGDPNYTHLYYVDASPYLVDVSTAVTSGCSAADYWACDRKTTYSSGKTLDLSGTSWRTILLGGMGLGGASRDSTDSCDTASECVKTPVAGNGLSSYFALDVTDPTAPVYLWEFYNTALGYSTVGPAVVRVGDYTKNGRWFAVFASGPTGPINTTTHQFMGTSNQNLKVFIVDLVSGALLRTIDTGIQNAFAGNLSGGTLDSDRWTPTGPGYYKDDAVYFGYTQKDTSTNTWTKGGVLRILTGENTNPVTTDFNPSQWTVSTVIDNIGPVTSAVTQLQDTTNKNLWLFFGTGRYYYKAGGTIDDADGLRALYGVKDPCYLTTNKIDNACSATKIDPSNLVDQTSSITATIPSGKNGWVINLDASDDDFKAERVITDPVAAPNGALFFITFKPSADTCSFGGNSALWGVNYYNGGALPKSGLKGQAIIQVSTGAFEEVKFDPAGGGGFTQENGRKTAEFQGVPPKNKPPVVSNAGLRPVKRIMHIQEK